MSAILHFNIYNYYCLQKLDLICNLYNEVLLFVVLC
jgi:hypothetical protein